MPINKTVQAVFDKAMYLIDAQNESTGATLTSDTQEYRVRTIGILNNLIDEVYPASDTFAHTADGKRPALPDIVDFSDELDLDAKCVREILPLGLAAELVRDESAANTNYFRERYEAALERALNSVPATFESIDSDLGGAYGGIEHGEFGYWS